MTRPPAPAKALLGLITLAFISLGLPDGSFGVAWPRMHLDLGLPLGVAGTQIKGSGHREPSHQREQRHRAGRRRFELRPCFRQYSTSC